MTILGWGAAVVVAGGVAAVTVLPMRRRRLSIVSSGVQATGPQPSADRLESEGAFRRAF